MTWTLEVHERYNTTVATIYFGDAVRGSIELQSEDEVNMWSGLVMELNKFDPLKHTKRSIGEWTKLLRPGLKSYHITDEKLIQPAVTLWIVRYSRDDNYDKWLDHLSELGWIK